MLSGNQIKKGLISLRRCIGWFATLLVANPEDRLFCVEAQINWADKILNIDYCYVPALSKHILDINFIHQTLKSLLKEVKFTFQFIMSKNSFPSQTFNQ